MKSNCHLFLILLILLTDSYVESQLVRPGKCRFVSISSYYNLMDLTGTWYEISGTPVPNLRLRKCVTMNVTGDYANNFRVALNFVSRRRTRNLSGVLTIKESNGAYQAQIQGLRIRARFNIIDLDGGSHAVIYACANFVGLRTEAIWILSREPTLSRNIYINAVQRLRRLKISMKNLKRIEQNNCPNHYNNYYQPNEFYDENNWQQQNRKFSWHRRPRYHSQNQNNQFYNNQWS